MEIRMTTGEVSLLKQLMAARDWGRTISARDCLSGIDRLVTEGCVLEKAVTRDAVLYSITSAGRNALVRHQEGG